jgi:Ceramidase
MNWSLDWTGQLFNYCERGTDPGFWAEPLNAVSNGAFVIAALLGARQLAAQPTRAGGAAVEWALVVLAALIGAGSFLFHTFATRWAVLTDVGAIFVFTVCSLGYALRRFFGASWLVVTVALAVFVGALAAFQRIPCDPGLLPVTAAAGRGCFNGTLGYAPVLIALAFYGSRLVLRGHPAGRVILSAAAVFALSMVVRTFDIEICALTQFFGRVRGTHALWHVFNAVTVYYLLAAAIRYGRRVEDKGSPALRVEA